MLQAESVLAQRDVNKRLERRLWKARMSHTGGRLRHCSKCGGYKRIAGGKRVGPQRLKFICAECVKVENNANQTK